MTPLLVVLLGLFFAYALYIAALAASASARPQDFLHAGGALPGWVMIFVLPGVVLGALPLCDHLLLTARYGLPVGQTGLGLVLVALCAAVVQKRLWLAARLTGILSPVELLGAYYQSVALRLFLFAVVLLFALPFAAQSLGLAGTVIAEATGGGVSRMAVVWIFGFFLFLFAAVGGWRGVIYGLAAQSVLVMALFAFSGAFSAAVFPHLPFGAGPLVTARGTLADQIPGVIQFSAGIGKQAPPGAIWTAVTIASFTVSLLGIPLSPAVIFLGNTSGARPGFAIGQVWMTAALVCGLLLLAGPILAAGMAATAPAGSPHGAPGFGALIGRFASIDQLAAMCLCLLLIGALQIAVAFFATAGAQILTLDLVLRFVLPDLTAAGQRLSARIMLALIFAALALMAGFAPLATSVLSSVTLSLSAQLLPAVLGLCWLRWFTRSGVVTGLILGTLLVLFTEPPGLIAFEGLFLDLPWGRWPLTVHSAAWGLLFNLIACLLVSAVTRGEAEPVRRLHAAFARDDRVGFGGDAARTAKWALALIWAYLAIGPGAILGNDFFSHPIFTDTAVRLAMPSLWVWQIMFWLAGVLLVWWLAYPAGLSVVPGTVHPGLVLADEAVGPLGRRRVPLWIAQSLARVTERPAAVTGRAGERRSRRKGIR
jgi:Na+/proline symporter